MKLPQQTTATRQTVVFDQSEFCGVVVVGDQRGRTIGFPTANLPLLDDPSIPLNGVYGGWITLDDGRRFAAAINIGVRPTIYASGVRLLEAHLLDFEGDLYDMTIAVQLTVHLRDEQRFDSLDGLVAQWRLDVSHVRAHIAGQVTAAEPPNHNPPTRGKE